MQIATLIIFAILGLIIWGLNVMAKEFTEFEHGFVYFAMGVVILVISTAVYMSYAAPTLATPKSRVIATPVADPGLTRQETNLLQE